MTSMTFSLGLDTYDNQPRQCTAADFGDFVAQISNTGSTRKGQAYICAQMLPGNHPNPLRYPGRGLWRSSALAGQRRFLALDADAFASPTEFTAFKGVISQTSSVVYTTASHTPQKPRARAIIELHRDVDRSEGIALGEAVRRMLDAVLGGGAVTLDSSVYRAEQPVYTPLVGAAIDHYQGPPLDVDATLAAYPPPIPFQPIPGTPRGQHLGTVSPVMAAILQPPETPTEIAKVQAALGCVSADCPYPDWIEILFALHSTGWSCAETLARGWSMSAPHRYDAAVFDSVWQHAKPLGGISIATLYHRAKQALPGSTPTGYPIPVSAVPALSSTDLTLGRMKIPTQPPPPRTYIFGEVVTPGTVAVLAGSGGTAKTGLAIQLCISGALGQKLGSIQVGSFASLMILAEESSAERDRRFGALCSRLTGGERDRVERMVHCRAEVGTDLRLTALKDGNPMETVWVDHIIALAQAQAVEAEAQVGLIVIDHARLVMGGDPISSDHVTALLRALNRIAVTTGAAVLLLAHSPKSTIGKDTEADAAEIFGSGAFVDHSRAALVMHTMRPSEAKVFGLSDDARKELVGLTVVKANYGPSNQKWWLRKEVLQGWQVVELEPAFLLPKGQAQMHSTLTKKIIDLVKRKPCQLSMRGIRDHAGTKRELGASERDVVATLKRALEEGSLILRVPTPDERKSYKLSVSVREIVDLP
jgi:hypothetical protein